MIPGREIKFKAKRIILKPYNGLLIFCIVITQGELAKTAQSTFVTLTQILQGPSSYEGKTLETAGRIDLEFESETLTLVECNGLANPKIPRQIWIDTSKLDKKRMLYPNHTYVSVRGVFTTKDRGHMGAFPGTLQIQDLKVIDSKEVCLKK